jgi:hypothetical protein
MDSECDWHKGHLYLQLKSKKFEEKKNSKIMYMSFTNNESALVGEIRNNWFLMTYYKIRDL